MSICELFPSDPSCNNVDEVVDVAPDTEIGEGMDGAEVDAEETGMMEEGEEMGKDRPMERRMGDGSGKRWLGKVGKKMDTLTLAERDPMGA